MKTVAELMAIYQVSRTTIQHWMKQGLPFYKIGKSVRFDATEVDTWVRGCKK